MKLEEAFKTIISLIPDAKSEEVPLIAAAGRVLAADVVAEHDYPEADVSRMDGYAVGQGSEGACLVVNEISAADSYEKPLGKGECVRVATGAKVPSNTEFVVPFENAHRSGENVTYQQGEDRKKHITHAGSDIRKGDVIARKGMRVDIRMMEIFASMRIPSLPCAKAPLVGVISTGSELTEDFTKPGTVNSNFYHMAGLLRIFDVDMKYFGVVPDDEGELSKTMKQAALECDMVITFGGTGFSRYDLLKLTVLEAGGEIPVEGVRIGPGKTFRFGLLGGRPLFMFPGSPAAAIACSEVFLVQAIRKWHGLKTGCIKAVSGFTMKKKKGFSKLVRTWLRFSEDGHAIVDQGGVGFPCVSVISEEAEIMHDGELVDVWLASKMLI
ncbi:molybdopterin molybdotransferase MoeA [Seleniivibrio woodruffii]|uniref:molybdopterin molybdotransferase MoeA n=1 Tax=Seleniivibrio woodruffii TaxID=1078050 RepID=UPI00240974F5|nr:molybdopterin molybdotransferase MoeA [Seleniivibrio woodruffii]